MKTGLLLATVAGFLLGQPAFAQSTPDTMESMSMPHGHGGMGHHMDSMHDGDSHFMMLLKSANLTPSQHAQVREILKTEKAQMKPVYDGFHALHEQIAAKLLGPGGTTAADLAPIEQKAIRYQEKIDRDMIDTALAIRNVLTPEQIARLAQVHQQLESLHSQIRNLLGPDADQSSETPN